MMGLKGLGSVLATVTTIALFLRGVGLVKKVRRQGSLGAVTLVPWAAQVASCTLWLKYGILIGDVTVILVNTFGALAGAYYLAAIHPFTRPTDDFWLSPAVGAAIAYPVLIGATFIEGYNDCVQFIGCCASFLAVALFGSPLAVVGKVIKNRHAGHMDYIQCLMGFICSASWTLYGTMIGDPFVRLPNLAGMGLAAGQLFLFLIYPGNAGAARKPGTPERPHGRGGGTTVV